MLDYRSVSFFKDHVKLGGCNLVWRVCDTFEAKLDINTYRLYIIYITYIYIFMKIYIYNIYIIHLYVIDL